jgi:hypothetical protein
MLYPYRNRRRSSCTIETLENRQLMSLTVDVRVAGGAKSAAVTSVGQVVNLEAWAVVTGSNGSAADDGVQDVMGSFVSSNVSGGAANGTLRATNPAPFNGSGAGGGVQRDLDGDGDLDIGSTNAADGTSYFFARANSMVLSGGTSSGGTHSYKIADLTFTVTSLNGGQTNINFVPKPNAGTPLSSATAVWQEDGSRKSTFNTTNSAAGFFAGSPVVLSKSGTGGGGGGGGGGGVTAGSISGTVWKDANSNGVQDSGEVAFSGFELYIDSNYNGARDSGEPTTTANGVGSYSFFNLPGNANYRVRAYPPSGYHTTAANGSTPYWDVFVASGQNVTGKNFGEATTGATTSNGSISGTVWKDANANGVRDSGESTFAGFELYIDKNYNGVRDSGEPTATANGVGSYSFFNLAGNGNYRVRAYPPSGFGTSYPVQPTPWWDVFVGSGQNVLGKDFGEKNTSSVSPGSIGGMVWKDTNFNGSKDSNESAFAGFQLYIDGNYNGIFDNGERTTSADGNGNYFFSNLGGNQNYRVRALPPSGWRTGTAGAPNPWWDVYVASGQNLTGKNFGERPA